MSPPIINPKDINEIFRRTLEEVNKAAKEDKATRAKDTTQRDTTSSTSSTTPNDSTSRTKDQFNRSRAGGTYVEITDSMGNRLVMPLSEFLRALQGAVRQHSPDDVHYDPGMLAQYLENLPPGELPHAPRAESQLPPVRVQIPSGENARPILEAIVRLLAPLDLRFQDGLRALLGNEQFLQLFQGGKLTQGATQLLPNHQLISVILPQGIFAQNPEAAKAFLIAQGLPASLIQHIPDQAVSGVLNSLLLASQEAGRNPLLFLQSVASVFTLAGVPVQQVQNLLLGMLREAQVRGLQPGVRGVTPEALEKWAARFLAVNNPQLLGLNQLVQENFGQGVTKILNAFIRVFFGGALMQTQQQWPQAVPNERMLAELGGLFAKQGERAKEEGKKNRRAKRKSRQVEAVEIPDYRRVERKEDLADEPPLPPQMPSIFVDMDEEG